jgi:hypothetical protein
VVELEVMAPPVTPQILPEEVVEEVVEEQILGVTILHLTRLIQ